MPGIGSITVVKSCPNGHGLPIGGEGGAVAGAVPCCFAIDVLAQLMDHCIWQNARSKGHQIPGTNQAVACRNGRIQKADIRTVCGRAVAIGYRTDVITCCIHPNRLSSISCAPDMAAVAVAGIQHIGRITTHAHRTWAEVQRQGAGAGSPRWGDGLLSARCSIKLIGKGEDIGHTPSRKVLVEGKCTSEHGVHRVHIGNVPMADVWLNAPAK